MGCGGCRKRKLVAQKKLEMERKKREIKQNLKTIQQQISKG